MNKGERLNRTVWTLFEKAGFETEPNATSPAEHEVQISSSKKRKVDLYARDRKLGVIIIASNKSGAIPSWSEHVNDYTDIGQKAGASKVLFVVTGKVLDQSNIDYTTSKNACFWDEERLRYFLEVVESIGKFAKFEILHDLGVQTSEETATHRVLALRLRQPGVEPKTALFTFTMTPKQLLKMCVILRRAHGSAAAYQRMLRRKRLPNVAKFVRKEGAILPTNIIVHLSEKATVTELADQVFRDANQSPVTLFKKTDCDLVVLNIPNEYASLELIDGQHRLYGFVGTDDATRKTFNLVVLGIKGLDFAKRRDTFVAINDNARRVDPNLVSFLRYTEDDSACQKDPSLMAIRVVVDLTKTDPFNKSIRLLDVGHQVITLKGFSGYDLKGLVGEKGLLRKYYPNNKPAEYVQALRLYFSCIKDLLKDEWKDPHTYIVATNRGVSAFLKLLRSILRAEKVPISRTIAVKYLGVLKSNWKSWETDKLAKTYVGSQGWKEFHRDMVREIKKRFSTFK